MSADTAWTITEALFVLALLAAGWGLWSRRKRLKRRLAQMKDPAFLRARKGEQAEAELFKMTRGDPKHVERLIAAEQKRNPDGDRVEWAVAAHKRWLADLR